MAVKDDIALIQGKTFTDLLRWETTPIVRIPIAGITTPNGAPRIATLSAHGLVDGWRAAVTGVKGMSELNAADPNKIKDAEYHQATVIDATTIEFNDINASQFKAWVSGGFIQYNTPAPLTGIGARMAIKAVSGEYNLLRCKTAGTSGATKPAAAGTDGTVVWEATTLPATKEWAAATAFSVGDVIDTKALMFLTVGNGRIVVDTTAKTIKRVISAADIAAISWKSAYYDLEAFSSDSVPVVTLLAYGRITVSKEETR